MNIQKLKATYVTYSWSEVDENGTTWWCAQEDYSLPPGRDPEGPVFRSRVSRQRAESYALAAHVEKLHSM